MLMLRLRIDTDEPADRNVRRRKRLPRDSWETAKPKALSYAMNAVDNSCDGSTIFPRADQLATAETTDRQALIREAPGPGFPWIVVASQADLLKLQAHKQAPADVEIDEHTVRLAFCGQQNDRGGWDGWLLSQQHDGSVQGQANNCHAYHLDVEICEDH